MNEQRIPPAVTFHFEKIIALVAEHARLDAAEWAIRSHELMGQLEHRWHEGVELGLSTDAAQQRALELFGDPEAVGRRFRKHWRFNLLFARNWRLVRIVIFLVALNHAADTVMIASLTATATRSLTESADQHLRAFDEMIQKNTERNKALFKDSNQSSSSNKTQKPAKVYRDVGFSTYDRVMIAIDKNKGWLSLIWFLAVAAPFLISMLATKTKLPRFADPRAIALMLPVVLGALFVAGVPIWSMLHAISYKLRFMALPGQFFEIGLGIFGSVCLLSDGFDLSGQRKERLLKILGYRKPA